MSARYIFDLQSEDRRRALPGKIILGQGETETLQHVLLKLLAYLLFFRERILVESRLDDDNIPYVPDVAWLDYELRPRLWIECGECSVSKLDKLAVKAPEAELWVMKRSRSEAEHLLLLMAREDLRRDRYRILALESEMFDEVRSLTVARNRLVWFTGQLDPPQLQFEYNGLWFNAAFTVLKF